MSPRASTAEIVRNVGFALLGVAVLVLKPLYDGPYEGVFYSYAGNFSVSFALYFAALMPLGRRRYGRLSAAGATLLAVELFELLDGFGVMANTYDPMDLVANAVGVGLAVLVDLATSGLVDREDADAPDRETIDRLSREDVQIVPYDPAWPARFQEEKAHLLSCLPSDLVVRIEHFGSTAVPGLAAKPIVDILVEVTDLPETKARIVPILDAQGYDYIWRPTHGDDGPPWYAWFIKRDPKTGARTHHIHMVEADFAEHWDRLLFRDYLIEHPQAADEYAALKQRLASASPTDRAAYTRGKGEFIERVTEKAKREASG
jgi:GrpB-like predicted nucleotidyltransferase (UPF0157 family)